MYASATAWKQWGHFCIYRDLCENPVLQSLRMEFSFVVFLHNLHNVSKVWNFKFQEQVGVCYLKNLKWFLFCFPSTAVHCGPWLPIHSSTIPNNIWSLHAFHTHTRAHLHPPPVFSCPITFIFPGPSIRTSHFPVCVTVIFFLDLSSIRNPKHSSSCEFSYIVFSASFCFMELGCQFKVQPQTWRTRVSLCLEPHSSLVQPGRPCQ